MTKNDELLRELQNAVLDLREEISEAAKYEAPKLLTGEGV